ncbi:MAG: hypothetical protein JSS27_14695 [Planctomycetes bacterium]|nr:hypothetical protein [Planctomycetota bacterium]
MNTPARGTPSFVKTAALFLAGGAVTAPFSASLYMLSTGVSLAWVLTVGMVVPTFTWAVQLSAAALLLPAAARDRYHNALGWVCWWGSVALLPGAVYNFMATEPALWLSAANVLASVAVMAVDLFRRARSDGISAAWPVSFCATIALNMAIFVASSWSWWPAK